MINLAKKEMKDMTYFFTVTYSAENAGQNTEVALNKEELVAILKGLWNAWTEDFKGCMGEKVRNAGFSAVQCLEQAPYFVDNKDGACSINSGCATVWWELVKLLCDYTGKDFSCCFRLHSFRTSDFLQRVGGTVIQSSK